MMPWFCVPWIIGFREPLIKMISLFRKSNRSSLHFLSLSFPRTERKMLYSPKRLPRGEIKEGQAVEETEILLVKSPHKAKEPSLFWALCLTFGPYFFISCLYKIIQDILMFVGPEILRWETSVFFWNMLFGLKVYESSTWSDVIHQVLKEDKDYPVKKIYRKGYA